MHFPPTPKLGKQFLFGNAWDATVGESSLSQGLRSHRRSASICALSFHRFVFSSQNVCISCSDTEYDERGGGRSTPGSLGSRHTCGSVGACWTGREESGRMLGRVQGAQLPHLAKASWTRFLGGVPVPCSPSDGRELVVPPKVKRSSAEAPSTAPTRQ